jgi:putative transposase
LADWCQQQGDDWVLEIVEREPGTKGFQVQPRRWVVERSFAWISRNRRLAKDYERKVQTSETLIEVAATRLLLRRAAAHQLLPNKPGCRCAAAEGMKMDV